MFLERQYTLWRISTLKGYVKDLKKKIVIQDTRKWIPVFNLFIWLIQTRSQFSGTYLK